MGNSVRYMCTWHGDHNYLPLKSGAMQIKIKIKLENGLRAWGDLQGWNNGESSISINYLKHIKYYTKADHYSFGKAGLIQGQI